MSQLVKLLRAAGRTSGKPAAGFGSRQETSHKRLVLVAALSAPDVSAARKALDQGADAVEVPAPDSAGQTALKTLVKELDAPVGVALSGSVPASFDFAALDALGLDYVKVEAGDVPAGVFLLEKAAVVLELKREFSDTMLKMLNFLPAKAVQVDSPDNLEGFTVTDLMEKRVDRELIGKPLMIKVGDTIKPSGAQLLALISPNGLVVPAADVAAWKDAVASIKDTSDGDDEAGGSISHKAPSLATTTGA